GAGEPRLLAWVVGGADPDGCLDALRRVLPPALVPAGVLPLDTLPRLPSGKVDRAALPLPEAPAAAQPAETPLQRAIADLWAEVLEVPAAGVGLDDDFFRSGGHSLMAMRLVTRLREVFGVGLQLNHLFDGPSVRGLERTLRELEGAPGHADTVADVWLAVAGELEEAARG
ncbi:MAG TPA: phosphopantetheine-binding protein, partial [Candidatus Dormibacteraeota bacterium]